MRRTKIDGLRRNVAAALQNSRATARSELDGVRGKIG
jgi:hypothetical protein